MKQKDWILNENLMHIEIFQVKIDSEKKTSNKRQAKCSRLNSVLTKQILQQKTKWNLIT